MDKPKLVYLSGPMTGHEDFNYPVFNKATARLRELGYDVINPAETAGGVVHLPRATYLRIDLGYVMASNAIAVLPGWENSNGASLEMLLGNAIDLPIHQFNWFRGLGARIDIQGVDLWTGYLAESVLDRRVGGCAAI